MRDSIHIFDTEKLYERDCWNRQRDFRGGGITYAHISIGGLKEKVSLTLLMNAHVGDEVRVESGVAMAVTSQTSRALVAQAFE